MHQMNHLKHLLRCMCCTIGVVIGVSDSGASTTELATSLGQHATLPVRLSLEEAIGLFLQQNLDLLITKYGIESSKGEQVTARLFPNPVASLGAVSSPVQGRTLGNSAR